MSNESKPIFIPRWRIEVRTSRASGPGGQGVNKTESKAEIRFNVDEADWIPPSVRDRFKRQNSGRINLEGEFILSCQVYRSQSRNLDQCFEKLAELLAIASVAPKFRKATRPTKSAQRKRLTQKKKHSDTKKKRQNFGFDE